MIIIVPVVGKDYGIIITILTIFCVLMFSYLIIKVIRKKCIKSIKFRIVSSSDINDDDDDEE